MKNEGWVIETPTGTLMGWTIHKFEEGSKAVFEDRYHDGLSWAAYKDIGYKCVEVVLTKKEQG